MAKKKPTIKVKVQSAGARSILTGEDTRAYLLELATGIADKAGEGFEPQVIHGRRRALASVSAITADAMRAEATDRVLTKAFGGKTNVIYTTSNGSQRYASEKQVAAWTAKK